MTSFLITGIIFGLSAGLAPGPLLTLVITETLQQNVIAGIKVALAPLITDLPIILVSVFLLAKLAGSNNILGIISIIGALFVFFIAFETLLTKPVNLDIQNVTSRSLTKGMLANALSPHPYLFWISVGAPIMTKAVKNNVLSAALFLLGFYAFLIGSKVALAVLVGKSKSILTGNYYLYTMRFLGLALIALALILLIDGIKLLGIVDAQ